MNLSPATADESAGQFRYRAFLSYRTADRRLAERLHKALEKYSIPKALRGRLTKYGKVGARVGSIFRDRDDSRTAEDIDRAIAHELERSQHLIVLCTPRVREAGSWVPREIEIFRARRPGAAIHAVIGAGTPPDCFPDALLSRDAVEAHDEQLRSPLAADLRRRSWLRPIDDPARGQDGFRRAVVKLVAGLTGLDFDELWQREAKRRRRRRFAAASVCILLSIVYIAVDQGDFSARGRVDLLKITASNATVPEKIEALLRLEPPPYYNLSEESQEFRAEVGRALEELLQQNEVVYRSKLSGAGLDAKVSHDRRSFLATTDAGTLELYDATGLWEQPPAPIAFLQRPLFSGSISGFGFTLGDDLPYYTSESDLYILKCRSCAEFQKYSFEDNTEPFSLGPSSAAMEFRGEPLEYVFSFEGKVFGRFEDWYFNVRTDEYRRANEAEWEYFAFVDGRKIRYTTTPLGTQVSDLASERPHEINPRSVLRFPASRVALPNFWISDDPEITVSNLSEAETVFIVRGDREVAWFSSSQDRHMLATMDPRSTNDPGEGPDAGYERGVGIRDGTEPVLIDCDPQGCRAVAGTPSASFRDDIDALDFSLLSNAGFSLVVRTGSTTGCFLIAEPESLWAAREGWTPSSSLEEVECSEPSGDEAAVSRPQRLPHFWPMVNGNYVEAVVPSGFKGPWSQTHRNYTVRFSLDSCLSVPGFGSSMDGRMEFVRVRDQLAILCDSNTLVFDTWGATNVPGARDDVDFGNRAVVFSRGQVSSILEIGFEGVTVSDLNGTPSVTESVDWRAGNARVSGWHYRDGSTLGILELGGGELALVKGAVLVTDFLALPGDNAEIDITRGLHWGDWEADYEWCQPGVLLEEWSLSTSSDNSLQSRAIRLSESADVAVPAVHVCDDGEISVERGLITMSNFYDTSSHTWATSSVLGPYRISRVVEEGDADGRVSRWIYDGDPFEAGQELLDAITHNDPSFFRRVLDICASWLGSWTRG